MNEDAAQATPLGFQISPGRAFMTTDGKPERDLTCLSPRPGEGDEKAQGESVRVHAFGYGRAVERALDIGVDSMQGVAPEGGDVSKEALLAVKADDGWEVATRVRRGRARSRRQRGHHLYSRY